MKPFNVLFVIRSAEHFLRYDSIVAALCASGHALTVLFDKQWSSDRDLEPVKAYQKKFPRLAHGWLVNRADAWTNVLFAVRSLLTYARYLRTTDQSAFFRDRWRRYLPFWLRIPASMPLASSVIKASWFGSCLRWIERHAPPDKNIVKDIRGHNPDVILSPLGGIRVMSPTIEYVKAASALGIPSASPTVSWDTLTTKGLMTVFPDIFLFWNEFHKQRAMEHHGVPAEKIRIIGAPVFDRWFGPAGALSRRPTARRTFADRYGLPPEKPYVLYLGSAAGTAENETWLIAALREALDRSSDMALKNLHIVVRPHPSNAKIYKNFSLAGVTLAPKGSGTPEEELQLSFDTYYHAAAVVGIFTSAMMEAQIMDKPVFVLLTDAYEETQLEAQHFQDFLKGDSLELVRNIEEFPAKIGAVLSGGDTRKEKRRSFVIRYIRPLGIGVSAGEAAAAEVEKLASDYAHRLEPT